MIITNLNEILNRETIKENIISVIKEIDKGLSILNSKKVIFISGPTGCGKSFFINSILNELNYDIINFETEQNRNSSNFDFIKSFNLSSNNVFELMNGNKKKICVLIDNLDSLNTNDKSGLTNLIKLIRPKKTIKQKKEYFCRTLIICICNEIVDKKILEFKKISYTFELEKPNYLQINKLIRENLPSIKDVNLLKNMNSFIENDIRKFFLTKEIFNSRGEEGLKFVIGDIVNKQIHQETKSLTSYILNNKINLLEHEELVNESDRTIVSLLFHENVIDLLSRQHNKVKFINIYNEILNNFCIGDFYDRITFQKQIWLFNELTSLIKNIKNNNLLEKYNLYSMIDCENIRFTKILTKYSTEYNNINFIISICSKLGVNKDDLKDIFTNLKNSITEDDYTYFEDRYEIKKLDISRLLRYIENKTTKEILNYE